MYVEILKDIKSVFFFTLKQSGVVSTHDEWWSHPAIWGQVDAPIPYLEKCNHKM